MISIAANAVAVPQAAGTDQLPADLWLLTGGVVALLAGIALFLPFLSRGWPGHCCYSYRQPKKPASVTLSSFERGY